MLLAAKGKAASYATVCSDKCPMLRGSVSHTPLTSSSKLVEPPVLEGGYLSSDSSNKYSNDTELKFKRIVIAKTATINMLKHNYHE
jgi:hypothetical protein